MKELILCALLALGAAPAAAQEPVTVMVLGTYHFANPGLDVVRTEVADVMEPSRQAEIARIAEGLARFRPTRVALEATPDRAARWDSLYAAYRAGTHALGRDEREQVGLRLASRMGLARVDVIDHPGEFPFAELMAYAGARDTAAARTVQEMLATVTAQETARQRGMGVIANLRARNDPRDVAAGQGFYMRLNAIGAGDGYAGATLVSRWYERNLRIFANLQRIARPGDRVVVIFGSGHSALLREMVRSTPGFVLAESNDYLPRR